MNDRSGDGTGSFEVKISTKTAKFTNMIIARFIESRYHIIFMIHILSKMEFFSLL